MAHRGQALSERRELNASKNLVSLISLRHLLVLYFQFDEVRLSFLPFLGIVLLGHRRVSGRNEAGLLGPHPIVHRAKRPLILHPMLLHNLPFGAIGHLLNLAYIIKLNLLLFLFRFLRMSFDLVLDVLLYQLRHLLVSLAD